VKRLVAPALLFGIASACGGPDRTDPLPASATACAAGQAKILIMDGMSKRLCGCQAEPNDTIVVPPATIDCTVPVGTTVFFEFGGTFREHQIDFTGPGQDGFDGHVNNPADLRTVRSHVVLFQSSAVYPFEDKFITDVRGSIIVP
jgi:hypothetical protein